MKVKQKVGVKQKLGSTMEESKEKKYWFEREFPRERVICDRLEKSTEF